jgi:hypothetical protein
MRRTGWGLRSRELQAADREAARIFARTGLTRHAH